MKTTTHVGHPGGMASDAVTRAAERRWTPRSIKSQRHGDLSRSVTIQTRSPGVSVCRGYANTFSSTRPGSSAVTKVPRLQRIDVARVVRTQAVGVFDFDHPVEHLAASRCRRGDGFVPRSLGRAARRSPMSARSTSPDAPRSHHCSALSSRSKGLRNARSFLYLGAASSRPTRQDLGVREVVPAARIWPMSARRGEEESSCAAMRRSRSPRTRRNGKRADRLEFGQRLSEAGFAKIARETRRRRSS